MKYPHITTLEYVSNDQLPRDTRIFAPVDGLSAGDVPLDHANKDRFNGAETTAAARATSKVLTDEPLRPSINRGRGHSHIINPDVTGSQPRPQRTVAYRNQRQRTVVQRIASMCDDYRRKDRNISKATVRATSCEGFHQAKTTIAGKSLPGRLVAHHPTRAHA